MPAGGHSDAFDSHCPSTAPEINSSGNSENWMVLSVAGEKPVPRFNVLYCCFSIFRWLHIMGVNSTFI